MNLYFYKRPFVPPVVHLYSYHALLPFLPDSSVTSIVEVGCGMAAFSFQYAARMKNTRIVAVDISQELIHFLSEHYGKYYENLSFRCLDFCEKPSPVKEEFDVVCTSDVLEHVYNVEDFIKNVHRCLKPGGRAIFNFPNEVGHGINHFENYSNVVKLFSVFDDLSVYCITLPKFRIDFFTVLHRIYDRMTGGKYTIQTLKLKQSEKQGVDCFHESSSFTFAKDHLGFLNTLACAIGRLQLIKIPKIKVTPITGGRVDGSRLIVVGKRTKTKM